ncbi:DNA-processing protein DprA [Bacillus carboniphilus]|uniref:DNA-processing protein DprA n=1 Tax=Bacillus carboniphilus TaxID=86663 RepID=A0ABY9K133_9BACI|nr:DNA-processing protein DprA [Bacillus carboniphilus]WLR43550.1 DNA-processing protein DprA [Bacillus carboniphilus]
MEKRECLLKLFFMGIPISVLRKYLLLDKELEHVEDFLKKADLQLNRSSISFLTQYNSLPLSSTLNQLEKQSISVITSFDDFFPQLLKHIPQDPFILFCKGDLSLLKAGPKVSIVGSRTITTYSKKMIQLSVPSLTNKDVMIVSGLAKGVDEAVHRCAIENGGKTIGVLPAGFNYLYPKENIPLIKFMMNHHLVISEFPPWIPIKPWHFPYRNRIISGLTKGTYIIQAAKSSGSLSTATHAINQGKDVWVAPAPFFEKEYEGNFQLLDEGVPVATPNSLKDYF